MRLLVLGRHLVELRLQLAALAIDQLEPLSELLRADLGAHLRLARIHERRVLGVDLLLHIHQLLLVRDGRLL